MRKIVHLSDLHFGRVRHDLVDPLIAFVNKAAPDLVAVSGDLTQRARHAQFEEARAFLDRIGAPCVVVPGNHDVPLDRIGVRLLAPYARYRRWIGADLEPCFSDERLTVVGLNTVSPLDWQRGRIGARAIERTCAAFAAGGDGRTRIVVAHHPFIQPPEVKKASMRGATTGVAALARCGTDIILSGHLHAWRAEPALLAEGHRRMLLIQAGTGLSTRLRGEDNDFNVLSVYPAKVTVEHYAARSRASEFELTSVVHFHRDSAGWSRTD